MDSNSRGFAEGEKVAKFSTYTLMGIGAVEVLVGQLSNSVALTADGLDAFGDACISFIIWFGLRISRKAPDRKFHYGYFKIETFTALVAAIVMVAVALFIIYEAYQRFLSPTELSYPIVALITLLGAGIIPLYRVYQMNRLSKKHGLISLKVGAYNSVKDSSGSFIAFFSVLASYFGLHQMDAVGGMIIAGFILSVAYVSIKESSLVLVDACHCPDLIGEIKTIVEGTYKVQVKDVRMRKLGPYLACELSIFADGNLSLYKVSELRGTIENDIRREINGIERITITAYPYPTDGKSASST